MNELIKIVENNGKKAVSARELYKTLGYTDSQFSRWSKKNIIENPYAIENEDYVGFDTNVEGNIVSDYALTTNFAKKLCMLSKTKVGEKIRDYFIEIEKRATKPLTQLDILAQSVQILQEQEKRIAEIDDRVKVIEAKQTTHQNWFTIAGYGTLQKMQIGIKLAASLGRKATNLCRQKGVEPEEIPDPRFGKVKTYPEDILKQVFEMPIN